MAETKNPHINCELTDECKVTVDINCSAKQMIAMLSTIILDAATILGIDINVFAPVICDVAIETAKNKIMTQKEIKNENPVF